MTSSVVGLIAPEVEKAEIDRAMRKPTDKLDSYDLYLRGMAFFYQRQLQQAQPLFTKAIELDFEYGAAYVMAAVILVAKQAYLGVLMSSEDRKKAIQLARDAERVGGDDAMVLARSGHVLTYAGQEYDQGMSMVERALKLNPNLSSAVYSHGWVALMCDEPLQSVESFQRMLLIKSS